MPIIHIGVSIGIRREVWRVKEIDHIRHLAELSKKSSVIHLHPLHALQITPCIVVGLYDAIVKRLFFSIPQNRPHTLPKRVKSWK